MSRFYFFAFTFLFSLYVQDISSKTCDKDFDAHCKENPSPTGKDKCEEYEEKYREESKVVPNDCSCSQNDRNEGKVIDCIQRACRDACEQHINEKAGYCRNISSENFCRKCFSDKYSVFNPEDRDLQTAKQVCARENNEKIRKSLWEKCKRHRPENLICPGGTDIRDHNCEKSCQRSITSQKVENLLDNKCDLTTNDGYEGCRKDLESLTALPKDPDQLPQGFSWQKCALNMRCAQEIEYAFNNALESCNNVKAQAALCCNDPVKCVEAGNASKALFMNSEADWGGMADKCRQIKETFSDVGSLGQKMASQCRDSASACVETCSEKIDSGFRQLFYQTCTFDILKETAYNPAQHTCSRGLIGKYAQKTKDELVSLIAQCESDGQKSNNLAQSAKSVLKSALSAAQCEEQARGGVDPSQLETPDGIRGAGPTSSNTRGSGASVGVPDASLTPWSERRRKDQIRRDEGGSSAARSSSQSLSTKDSSGDEGSDPKVQAAQQANRAGSSKKEETGNAAEASHTGSVTTIGAGGRLLKGIEKKAGDTNEKAGEEAGVEKDELSFRQFAGAKGKNQKPSSGSEPSWAKIKPRQNLNTRISSFGSPHDDIFKRISNRIIVLCRQEKLYCP